MSFTQGAILFSLFLWHGFLLFRFLAAMHSSFTLSLPRHRGFGTPLALIALFWSSYHVSMMLEGGAERYQGLVLLLVPVATVLAYFYLSFLFARALGGIILLAVSWLLQAGYATALPARPLFSLVGYLLALAGALLVAVPWTFRDLLEAATDFAKVRNFIGWIFVALTVFFLIYAFLG